MDKSKRENFKAWLAWLRANPGKQGNGQLKQNTTEGDIYCCLGVACDMSKLGTWDDNGYYNIKPGEDLDGSSDISYMPYSVGSWLGFRQHMNIDIRNSDGQLTTVAALNDSGVSFGEIADLLEAQFPDSEWV